MKHHSFPRPHSFLVFSRKFRIPNFWRVKTLECSFVRSFVTAAGRARRGRFYAQISKCSCCLADRILCISVFISAAEPLKREVKMLIEKGVVKLRIFWKIPLWLRQLYSWFHHQNKAFTHKIIPAICRITGIVQFQKISNLLILRRVIGISKPKVLKQTINQNWNNVPERWRGGGVGDNICQRSIGF